MAKKEKLKTPDWILEGYDSEEDYNKAKGIKSNKKKGKTFKIRECPKCHSDDVGIVLSGSDSEESTGTGDEWECHKCKWKGHDIVKKELTEDELMKYMDEKGEETA
jgi:hypothetical protein